MTLEHHRQVCRLRLGARVGAITILALGEHNGWSSDVFFVDGEIWRAHDRHSVSLALVGDELIVCAKPGTPRKITDPIIAQLKTISRIAPQLKMMPTPAPTRVSAA